MATRPQRLGRLSLLVALLFNTHVVRCLSPLRVEGQDFIESSSGRRFEIIGSDYQPGGESGFDPTSGRDPLSNEDVCIRDAALMQAAGFNTIRVYNLSPDVNHDACMSIFNAVGIRVLLDVNSPIKGDSIDRDDPAGSYTTSYLERIFSVVDAFSPFPNVLGFFSANEIINEWPQASEDPPYIRAVTRDLKQYIAARGGRRIPVGYSATDFRDALVDTSEYLQCYLEESPDSASDFFGLNSYSWCGRDATIESSTYDDLARFFRDSAIPVFFSEYGCNDPRPRYFTEVPVLYGPRMEMFSGGLVYEWTEEVSNFGLVQIQPDGSVKILADYENLRSQYSNLNRSAIFRRPSSSSGVSIDPKPCSASLISDPRFSTDFNIPPPPAGAQQLIDAGAGGRKGRLVPVTKTAVQTTVTRADGSMSTGLTITLLGSQPATTMSPRSPSMSATTRPQTTSQAVSTTSPAPQPANTADADQPGGGGVAARHVAGSAVWGVFAGLVGILGLGLWV